MAVAVALVLYVWPLTQHIPLLDPDEGIHAAIAREMAESGDWVTPRFLGRPFFDKPILFFWVEAASIRLFGPTEMAVRAPTLAYGFLAMLTTGLLGGALYGRPLALTAALIYATMVLPASLDQAAVHDVALVPWTNLTLWFFWRTRRSRTGLSNWSAAGVVLGLACLTKGLLGVALACLTFGLFLVIARELTWRAIAGFVVAFGVAAAVAAPWFAAMEHRHPGYAEYYFWARHIRGYLTSTQLHAGRDWWYYVGVLLGGALPWTPLFFLSTPGRGSRASSPDAGGPATRLLWAWIAASLVFLSIAGSKLYTYLLPVFPAAAILVAAAIHRDGKSGPAARALTVIWSMTALIGSLLLPIALGIESSRFRLTFPPAAWGVAIAIFAGWWLTLQPWSATVRHRFMSIVVLMSLTFLLVMRVLLPPVAQASSARDLAEYYNRAGELPPRLAFVNERLGSFIFYLEPALRATATEARVFGVSFENLAAEWTRPGTVVVVPVKVADRVQSLGTARRRIGHYLLFAH